MSEVKVIDKDMEFTGLVLAFLAVLQSCSKKCSELFNP
jgi:hypothetical protein